MELTKQAAFQSDLDVLNSCTWLVPQPHVLCRCIKISLNLFPHHKYMHTRSNSARSFLSAFSTIIAALFARTDEEQNKPG